MVDAISDVNVRRVLTSVALYGSAALSVLFFCFSA